MTVYISMLILVFILGITFQYQRSKNSLKGYGTSNNIICNLLFVAIVTVFVFVAGFRFQVGADFSAYYENYDYYANSSLNIFEENEIGIRIIAKIARLLYDTPQTYIFLCSLVTMFLFLTTIKKYSERVSMSLMLFVFLGMFIGSFNAVRQYLAGAVLFFGLRFVFEEKPIKWILSVMVAFFCHTAAIFMLPMYWLARMKNRKRFFVILIVVSIFAFTSYDRIFDVIDSLKGNVDSSVADRLYAQNSVSLFRVAVSWAPVILCYFPKRIYEARNEKDRILLNYVFIAAALQTVSMNSTYLARFCTFTTATNIFTIPMLMKYQSSDNRKILTVMVYACYFMYWTAEATGPFVVNYQWCF